LPQDAKLAENLISECKKIYLSSNHQVREVLSEEFDHTFIGKISNIISGQNLGIIEYGQKRFFFPNKDANLNVGQKVRFRVHKINNAFETRKQEIGQSIGATEEE
jgi:DNA-directed RNA polymerase subunit E'/Rpb7